MQEFSQEQSKKGSVFNSTLCDKNVGYDLRVMMIKNNYYALYNVTLSFSSSLLFSLLNPKKEIIDVSGLRFWIECKTCPISNP